MNNEISGKKRGNYSKTIKQRGPFRPSLVKLSHRKIFKNGVSCKILVKLCHPHGT